MYGGKIVAPDGSVWLAPDVTPLNMVQRFDMTVTTNKNPLSHVIQTNVPQDRPFMYFSRTLNRNDAGIATMRITQNGYHAIMIMAAGTNTSQTVDVATRFYIFSNFVPGNDMPSHGVAFYNAAGEMTWACHMMPLQLYRQTMPLSSESMDVGFPCAVTSSFCKTDIQILSPGVGTVYLVLDVAWGAIGNNITRQVVNYKSTTSAAVTWDVRDFFYINTTIYDM